MLSLEDVIASEARVLVVGAGPSGLVALKELLEAGIPAVAIEQSPRLGGLFDCQREGPSVYDSTLLTVSNYFMAFSSMPPERHEARRYWTHRDYIDYLRRFAARFGLAEHIAYGVTLDELAVDEGAAGARAVHVQLAAGEGAPLARRVEAIALCTGTHRIPKYPDLPGLDSFRGQVHHAAHYKNAEAFAGRRVVCIGLGETGADVVHELARVTATTTLSLRHYPAVVERYPFGLPHTNDAFTTRAFYSMDRPTMQLSSISRALRRQREGGTSSERLLNDWTIRSGGIFGQWLTKNDAFVADVAEGRVAVNLAGVERVEPEGLVFTDGERVEADVIMCCTGYAEAFPAVAGVEIDCARSLYKHMFHPALRERVAFIGWARPEVGGQPVCSELQARYFVELLRGARQLPPPAELDALIAADRRAEQRRFSNAPRPGSVVCYSSYCDALARLIGCHPLEHGDLRDPKLWLRLWLGSQIGAQYRLVGPGAEFERAREVLLRLPIATPPVAAPFYALELNLRRAPIIERALEQRSLTKARALVREYIAEHGGDAVMPS